MPTYIYRGPRDRVEVGGKVLIKNGAPVSLTPKEYERLNNGRRILEVVGSTPKSEYDDEVKETADVSDSTV